MIRLYRKHGKQPPDWLATVRKSLPNHQYYLREAARFEALHLNSNQRRFGFAQFAAHVLILRSGKVVFPSCWSTFKDHLFSLSHSKCSYCEGEINSNRAGHVEHFKPKILFPSLAYAWTNYFLACAGCNGAKGEKWPARGGYVRPDKGDPAKLFRFERDGTIHAVRSNKAAKQTIEDFDLQRKWLVARRKFWIEHIQRRVLHAEWIYRSNAESGCRLAAALVAEISDSDFPYSAALTDCFRRSWPAACPKVKTSKRRQ